MGIGQADRLISKVFRSENGKPLDNFHISGFEFIQSIEGYNIFCFSRKCNISVAESFPGYDMVAQIDDIFGLAKFIVYNFCEFSGYRYFLGQVNYADRAKSALVPMQNRLEALIEKPVVYGANCEGRIIFVPPGEAAVEKVEPKIIRDPALCSFFRSKKHPLAER